LPGSRHSIGLTPGDASITHASRHVFTTVSIRDRLSGTVSRETCGRRRIARRF